MRRNIVCLSASILSVIVLSFSSAITVLAEQGKVTPLRPLGNKPGSFVAGQILVKFQPGVSRAEQADIHHSLGGVVKREIVQIGVQVVSVPRGREEQRVESYSNNPNVLFAEVDALREHPGNLDDGGNSRKGDLHNDGSLHLNY